VGVKSRLQRLEERSGHSALVLAVAFEGMDTPGLYAFDREGAPQYTEEQLQERLRERYGEDGYTLILMGYERRTREEIEAAREASREAIL